MMYNLYFCSGSIAQLLTIVLASNDKSNKILIISKPLESYDKII